VAPAISAWAATESGCDKGANAIAEKRGEFAKIAGNYLKKNF
jgi:hypothetical protein